MSSEAELRKSQLISTYGPGSLLDLPKKSVIVGSLENWKWEDDNYHQIKEPRLSRKVSSILDVPNVELRTPPEHKDSHSGFSPQKIRCYTFPEWFMTAKLFKDDTSRYKYRILVNIRQTVDNKGQKFRKDNRNEELVPARFVQCCPKGHISDIDWVKYVHKDQEEVCTNEIRMEERGTTGDFSEIQIVCRCGAERPLYEASIFNDRNLGYCNGQMPWLGSTYKIDNCQEPNRLLTRTASNAYFPQKVSAISIREEEKSDLRILVEQNFDDFFTTESTRDNVVDALKMPIFKRKFKGHDVDAIWKEVEVIVSGAGDDLSRPIKEVEFDALNTTKEELGMDVAHGDFFARKFWKDAWDSNPYMKKVANVTLVHRLKEVTALIGFSRLTPISKNIYGEYDKDVQLARLSDEISWVPAIETNGEGVFITLKKEELDEWANRSEVQKRYRELETSFNIRSETSNQKKTLPPLQFILLHSLSHMLITAISLECGYSSSSIRERIYFKDDGTGGILLYTASSDSEGTLGGLVEVGRNIDRYLTSAIRNNELCSNDPVCSYKDLTATHTNHDLSGTSCHGCLFISETSCEMMNEFLDRALVVSTLANNGCEFFKES